MYVLFYADLAYMDKYSYDAQPISKNVDHVNHQ